MFLAELEILVQLQLNAIKLQSFACLYRRTTLYLEASDTQRKNTLKEKDNWTFASSKLEHVWYLELCQP